MAFQGQVQPEHVKALQIWFEKVDIVEFGRLFKGAE